MRSDDIRIIGASGHFAKSPPTDSSRRKFESIFPLHVKPSIPYHSNDDVDLWKLRGVKKFQLPVDLPSFTVSLSGAGRADLSVMCV